MASVPPPHDLEAEGSLLTACMMDTRAFDAVAKAAKDLAPEEFYSGRHRYVWEAICELRRTGKPQDVTLVLAQLKAMGRLGEVGGASGLTELMNEAPAVGNPGPYAKIVRERARHRALILAGQRIVAEGYAHTGELQPFVDRAAQWVNDLACAQVEARFERFGDVVRRIAVEARRAAEGHREVGVPSGIRGLDRHVLGLRRGRLYVLAARPGVGKTALAMTIAAHVGRQPRTSAAFFTLEMDNEELATREIAGEASIDTKLIETGKLHATEWRRFDDAVERADDTSVWMCDDANINGYTISALARERKAELERRGERLGLVVVDYLQLIESTGRRRSDSREQEVASVSRGLKKLAKELRVPIIALSQLSRKVEERGKAARPLLSDLRESGSLEQDADVVMFVHRLPKPKAAGPQREGEWDPHELIIAKARGGSRGVVPLGFKRSSVRFVEVEQLSAAEESEEEG